MIRRAFEVISDIPTRLICFSDDLDGMRKIPDNVPNQEMLREHLQRPLTSVPDPFGQYDSFGGHNNAMLRRFLRGFVYLAIVLDWFSRRVLAWRLSITMESSFCVETLEEPLARHGKPEVFNTDQGSQFSGTAFTGVLASNGIAISMDGKGDLRDNVFVERLRRSVKYEEVYLRAHDGVGEARSSIGRYLDFYVRHRAFEP